MSYRVMVVEDDAILQDFYTFVLQEYNLEVINVQDGVTAVKQLETNPPHMMILDINLPGLSGVDVLKYARHKLGLERLKIAVITANAIVRQTGQTALADAYMEKPVDDTEFFNTLERLIDEIQEDTAVA